MTSRTCRAIRCRELPSSLLVDGDVLVTVDQDLRDAYRPGDKLLAVLVPPTGAQQQQQNVMEEKEEENDVELLLLPKDVIQLVDTAISHAVTSSQLLRVCTEDQITQFFLRSAALLESEDVWKSIKDVNAADVAAAASKGRSTTRLAVSDAMRASMIDGLRTWANKSVAELSEVVPVVEHADWTCSTFHRELGLTAFVFEGRPNVVVDAVGVLRYRNTVVMRIGSDALATAATVLKLVIQPALRAAGMPEGAVQLIQSPSHAAGWALFSDSRVGLAVARGSGRTVKILGSIAASHGIPTSLHGKGGAWGVVSPAVTADGLKFARDVVVPSIAASLDRKVCNTLNTILVPRALAPAVIPLVLEALSIAGQRRSTDFRLHYTSEAEPFVPAELKSRSISIRRAIGQVSELQATRLAHDLGHEWEWEDAPEVTLHVFDGPLDAAIALYNHFSPRFVLSLWSPAAAEHQWVLRAADAPFIGDRHTRWVDGQKALRQPELGLCNWESGRLLGRAGILTGADVGTTVLTYRSKEASA